MSSSRFFCHACQRYVPLRNQDLICDRCGSEFVEQMPQPSISHPVVHRYMAINALQPPGLDSPPGPASSAAGAPFPSELFRQLFASPHGPRSMSAPSLLNTTAASERGTGTAASERGTGTDNNGTSAPEAAANTGGGVPRSTFFFTTTEVFTDGSPEEQASGPTEEATGTTEGAAPDAAVAPAGRNANGAGAGAESSGRAPRTHGTRSVRRVISFFGSSRPTANGGTSASNRVGGSSGTASGTADAASTNSTVSSVSSDEGGSSSNDIGGSTGTTAAARAETSETGSGSQLPAAQNMRFLVRDGAGGRHEVFVDDPDGTQILPFVEQFLRNLQAGREVEPFAPMHRRLERLMGPNVPRHGSVSMNDFVFGNLDAVLTQLLDHMEDVNTPVDPRLLGNIPIVNVDQATVDSGTACPTCMEQFTKGERVAKLNCDHLFHRDCILPWLERRNTCPVCRQEVDPTVWPDRDPLNQLD